MWFVFWHSKCRYWNIILDFLSHSEHVNFFKYILYTPRMATKFLMTTIIIDISAPATYLILNTIVAFSVIECS